MQKERIESCENDLSLDQYSKIYQLSQDKLELCKPDAVVMHPGPMNRGVEIDGIIADDLNKSVIQEQVEIGVALRMAILHLLVDRQK